MSALLNAVSTDVQSMRQYYCVSRLSHTNVSVPDALQILRRYPSSRCQQPYQWIGTCVIVTAHVEKVLGFRYSKNPGRQFTRQFLQRVRRGRRKIAFAAFVMKIDIWLQYASLVFSVRIQDGILFSSITPKIENSSHIQDRFRVLVAIGTTITQ